MPEREGGYVQMELMPLEQRLAIDHQYQAHWYHHIAQFAAGKSILDVGAGTGYGIAILKEVASEVVGFDPLPAGQDVIAGDIADYATDSFDWVVALDVIEHVADDHTFYKHMKRVAREKLFISTPNWLVSRAHNEYHVREYTPNELLTLVMPNQYELWVSDWQNNILPRPDGFDGNEPMNNFGVLITL